MHSCSGQGIEKKQNGRGRSEIGEKMLKEEEETEGKEEEGIKRKVEEYSLRIREREK
jgi:hypothetical protein